VSGSRSSDREECYLEIDIVVKISFPSVKPSMHGFLAQTRIDGQWWCKCKCSTILRKPRLGGGRGYLGSDGDHGYFRFFTELSTGKECYYPTMPCIGKAEGVLNITRPMFFPRTWISLGGECDRSITAFDLINSMKWDGKEWELDGILRSCGSKLTMKKLFDTFQWYSGDNTFGKALAQGMDSLVNSMSGTFLATDCGPPEWWYAQSRGGSSNI